MQGLRPGVSSTHLVLIPSYNPGPKVYETVRGALAQWAPVWVVVDGSNVLYWKDGTPQIAALREVVRRLQAQGLTPAVVLDANAGYLVAGRYRGDFAFGRMLELPHDQVMVVPRGSPADPTILQAARARKARVVTNDRYRDWARDFPEVDWAFGIQARIF